MLWLSVDMETNTTEGGKCPIDSSFVQKKNDQRPRIICRLTWGTNVIDFMCSHCFTTVMILIQEYVFWHLQIHPVTDLL